MLNRAKAHKQQPKKKKIAFARTDKEYIFNNDYLLGNINSLQYKWNYIKR